jgi:alpha-methylacyl-CoA racemase
MKDTLTGYRVLDFSTLLPGPLATLMLAEAGAAVTKIEPPGGEDMRRFPPFLPDGTGACHTLLNRGKTILELDLKAEAGRAALAPLLAEADVLVEQFRPGVMARLGLSHDAVRAVNPRIVYCSITGFGQTGPRRDRAGHDISYMAESGLLGLTAGSDGLPILPPVLSADIAGGTYPAVIRIALALLKREKTGEGAYLDISMTDMLRPFAWWSVAIREATGRAPGAGDWILNGGSPRYGIHATSDGRAVAVGALEDKFWHALCDAVDLPEELRDDRRDPRATREGLADAFARHPASRWRSVLAVADCCCAVVEPMEDVLASDSRDATLFASFLR